MNTTSHTETSSKPKPDAIALLKVDHLTVKALFSSFENASEADQGEIAAKICAALTVHTQIEEEILYPAARATLGLKGASMLDEAKVEHDTAKDLIEKIEMSAPGRHLFSAWVKVLGEYIQHHVMEEEGELFPRLRASDMNLHELGNRLAARKNELLKLLAQDAAKNHESPSALSADGRRDLRSNSDGAKRPAQQ